MYRSPLLHLFLIMPFAHGQFGLRRVPPVRPEVRAPEVPVVDPDPAFPLRVHLFLAKWGGLGNRNHGYGTGNLLDGSHVQGFDYGFECDVPFVANEAVSDTYQARWKRSSYQLEILTGELGGKHRHTCNLHLALEGRPFDATNGTKWIHGVSSSLRVPWQDPDFAYEQPDHGWGIANVSEPPPGSVLKGADFNYECNHGFLPNSQSTNYYQGHWVKPGVLEVLLKRAGSDKVDKCMVKVAVRPQPYPVRQPQLATAGDALP